MAPEQMITEHIDLWTSAIKAKKTQGRGSSKKRELYGIKKLREMILELAVRGKLVPQKPCEEPANVLLERIADKKEQLIKAKKIKKAKSLPKIAESEISFNLPSGWSSVRLGDVVTIIRGITFPGSEKTKEPAAGRVACLRTTNVQKITEWDDLLYVDRKFVTREDQFIQKNDILMSMANSRELVGKVSFVDRIPVETCSFGGFLSVLRPYELNPLYLMAVLRSTEVINTLVDSASQTTNIANISLEKLNPLIIYVPPLAEQHRIITKFDELMALCDQLEQQTESEFDAHQLLVDTLLATLTSARDADELSESWARLMANDGLYTGSTVSISNEVTRDVDISPSVFDRLFTTDYAVEQLKQTILQLAVMGKLVSQDPSDEPASELLKRIAVEKEQLINEKKIKKQKALPEITDEEKPFELPGSWAWVRPEEFSKKITDGEHFRPPVTDSGIYFLSAKDIRAEGVSLENPLFISEDTAAKALQRCDPEKDDLLIVSRGATVGRMCKVNITETFCLLGSVILIKPTSLVLSDYLSIALKSPNAFNQLINASGSTAQPAIYLRDLKSLIFPLPPINEQHRIAAKVNQLMMLCDQIKNNLNEIQKTQEYLADAVVLKVLAQKEFLCD